MTTQYLSGRGMMWPNAASLWGLLGRVPALSTTALMDASTEIVAMVGRLWMPGSATSKNISKIHLRLGAVTAGVATFRVSLQDVDTANGPPVRPDGGVDENVTIATTGLTANAVNSFTLGATRAVTRGQLLAIVCDFSAFTSLASIVVSGLRVPANDAAMAAGAGGAVMLFTGSWAAMETVPNVVIEFDDGTFGTLQVNTPFSALNQRQFNSGTSGSGGGLNAGDERGLEFTVDAPRAVDGCWISLSPSANNANFDVVLYAGTTALQTVSVDANTVHSVAITGVGHFIAFGGVELLSPGTTYRLMVKPTTSTNVSLVTVTLAAAGHRVLLHGTNSAGNSRVDAGAFGTPDTTELPVMALNIVGMDDGASAGAGKMIGAGGMLAA